MGLGWVFSNREEEEVRSRTDLMNLAGAFRQMTHGNATTLYQKVERGEGVGLKLPYYRYALWLVRGERQARELIQIGVPRARICRLGDFLGRMRTLGPKPRRGS